MKEGGSLKNGGGSLSTELTGDEGEGGVMHLMVVNRIELKSCHVRSSKEEV